MSAKFPGLWYSTVSAGYCGDGTRPEPEGCTWRVAEVVKIVNKTCHDDKVVDTTGTWNPTCAPCGPRRVLTRRAFHVWRVFGVAEQDTHGAPCFAKCTDSGVGLGKRNVTSPCWIQCLFTAVLGPEAGIPGAPIAGMALSTIAGAWDSAFELETEGGCPALTPPTDAGTPAAMARPLSNGAKWHGFPGFNMQ